MTLRADASVPDGQRYPQTSSNAHPRRRWLGRLRASVHGQRERGRAYQPSFTRHHSQG